MKIEAVRVIKISQQSALTDNEGDLESFNLESFSVVLEASRVYIEAVRLLVDM
jgi:hypothetical protein